MSIIFIPFTTLTGYWGMNLTDVRDSTWDQRRFWHFCGGIVVLIAALCACIALLRYLLDKRELRKAKKEKNKKLSLGPANRRLERYSV